MNISKRQYINSTSCRLLQGGRFDCVNSATPPLLISHCSPSNRLIYRLLYTFIRLTKLTESGVLHFVKEKYFNIDLSKCSADNLETESVKLQVNTGQFVYSSSINHPGGALVLPEKSQCLRTKHLNV